MKKLLPLLLLVLTVSIISCTKEDPIDSPKQKVSLLPILLANNWTAHYTQTWDFVNETTINAQNLQSPYEKYVHTYKLIEDSLVVNKTYNGILNTVWYPNLRLSNDTIYWKYSNSTIESVILFKR